MSIYRRALCVAAFAFSLCAWADDPVYYLVSTSQGDFGTYIYNPSVSSSDSFSGLAFSRDKSSFSGYVSINDSSVPFSGSAISYQDYSDGLTSGGIGYIPFSSDPVYSSNNPNGAPFVGVGSDPSGGGGEGGFDPVGFFGELPAFMSGLSSAVLTVLSVAAFVFLSFIAWRKFRYSSKRV